MEINGDEYEAERYYLKSCKNDFTKAQYRLAYLYDRQDKREDAIEFYEKGIEHNFSLSKFRLANLCNRENEIERAKMYYDLASNDMVEAKNNLAGLYFEEENYEKAPEIVDNLYDKVNNLSNISSTLGNFLTKLSNIAPGTALEDTINKINATTEKLESAKDVLGSIKNQLANGQTYNKVYQPYFSCHSPLLSYRHFAAE